MRGAIAPLTKEDKMDLPDFEVYRINCPCFTYERTCSLRTTEHNYCSEGMCPTYFWLKLFVEKTDKQVDNY